MHILFLTDNFPPEVNAPASRTFEHCREWVKEGHKVTVLTCVPNFPSGKVFDGYHNAWKPVRQSIHGIQIVRVWSYIAANEGLILRTLDYLSYMVSAIIFASTVRGVDTVVGTSPQFFTAWAACITAWYKRVPFIFELRDMWPESIRAVGALQNRHILRGLEFMELFLYRRAKGIVSVTKSFKENLIHRGVEPDKISVVTNGVDLTRFSPGEKSELLVQDLGLQDQFVVGYIGTHGMAHALETLLFAGQQLAKMGEKKVTIVFLGDGARKEYLQHQAFKLGLSNIKFLPSVTKDEVANYWRILDASVIHLKKDKVFKAVIPSKLFECMGMGIPVLHGVQGESAEIVEQNKVGLLFEPENPDELCKAILKLYNDPILRKEFEKNCRNKVVKFDRKRKANEMLSIIQKLGDGQ